LKDQIDATRKAAVELVKAHVDLAKAEGSAIGGRILRAAALAGVALAVLLEASILLVIGTSLFLGEWLFGSMGWGVLHGVLLLGGIATAAILVALGVPAVRIGRSFLVAAVVGAVFAVVLGLDLPNRLYTAIGDSIVPGVEPGVRPLAVGIAVGAIIGLLVGIVLALRLESSGSRLAAVIAVAVVGALAGALSAITFGVRVGIGLGIAVGYLAWIVLMVADIVSSGVNLDTLKARFYPSQTIDTSKETLEWLQTRMPPGTGS